MSLDVYINFKEPRQYNYFLEHPYIYNFLSERDKQSYSESDFWSANITHNLIKMAEHIPINYKETQTTLYYVCWRPEEIGIKTVEDILPCLIQGLHYMIDNRKELEKFNAYNDWGTYNEFMKFLLNYKQACEDNDKDCLIETDR